MTIYLGPPGNLQALPYMGRGIDSTMDLGATVQRSLGGARTVDYVGTPKRTYGLERKYLTVDELGQIEGLALGLYGAGPYALLDPWRRNLFTLNQSSAGDYSRDTSGFTGLSTGTVGLSGPLSTQVQGTYAITYLSPASGAAGTAGLVVGSQATAAAVIAAGTNPVVVPTLAYTFQAMVKTLAGTAASWRATIAFYDAAGAIIGSATNGTAAVITGSFVVRSVTATAPALAAYAVCSITNNATLIATNTIAVDAPQIDQSSTVDSWVPGTGVPRVAFTTLGNTYPTIVDTHDATLQLQEVG